MSSFKKKEKIKNSSQQPWDLNLKSILIGFILSTIAILFLPWLLTSCSIFNIDFSDTGDVGDTIGGITGPFIAIIAAALTYLAFRVQYEANEQQKLDLKTERFESKFYEMLRLHRANVEEMNIAGKVEGRKVFVRMFYELRQVYLVADGFLKNDADILLMKEKGHNMDDLNLMHTVYDIFFHGIGDNSEKVYTEKFTPSQTYFFNKIKERLTEIEKIYLAKKSSKGYYHCPVNAAITIAKGKYKYDIDLFYKPFNGHANRLGHYYRHLYHTANFIVKQDFLSEDEKQDYINILRAQMSSFEQLMLYYNATSWFSKLWKELFTKYSLIKNIPIQLADFGDKPLEIYANEIKAQEAEGKDVFENHKKEN